MSNLRTEAEKVIVDTIRMRLTTEQALQYLPDHGFSISRATFFRHKKKLKRRNLKDFIIWQK